MVQETNGDSNEQCGEGVGTFDVVEKPRKPKRLTVKPVGKVGRGIIVERDGERFIVPPETLEHRGDTVLVLKDDLDAALPYGAKWENHLEVTITADNIVNALRERGIWTVEDFGQRFAEVRQVVTSLIMPDVVRMYQDAAYQKAKEV